MRVLLVEPAYRRAARGKLKGGDANRWFPPLGLMKLARFHKRRGDEVAFTPGADAASLEGGGAAPRGPWDRIYISTLFTFHFSKVVKTVNFYKQGLAAGGGRLFVGGFMASMHPKELFEATGIRPVSGALTSPEKIGLEGDENIDLLPPDYGILPPDLYGIHDTYYWYSSRGCVLKCDWCATPGIEPTYERDCDLKEVIGQLRAEFGDKPHLKLMDNNILAAGDLRRTIDDLVDLGYGRGNARKRTVHYTQGLDAALCTEEKVKDLARLELRPLGVAFERAAPQDYERVVALASKYGFTSFEALPKSAIAGRVCRCGLPRREKARLDAKHDGPHCPGRSAF